MSDGKSKRVNTLGLQRRQLDQVLDALDRAGSSGGQAADKRRRFKRRPYRQLNVPVRLNSQGTEQTLVVACRDLSRGGMSFLHSTFVYEGTAIIAAIPHADGSHVGIKGTVVRCQHRSGVVHEIGVRFDHEIDPRDVLSLDPQSDCYSLEHVNTEELEGNVLVIADDENEQRVVRHFLRGTQLSVKSVASTDEAGDAITGGRFDVVVTQAQVGDSSLATIVERLRSGRVRAPILVLADPKGPALSDDDRKLASGFLPLPVDGELLLRAIAEYLCLGHDNVASEDESSLPSDDPNAPLVPDFVKQLHEYAQELAKPTDAMELETLRAILLGIKGSASPMGFSALGDLAGEVLQLVQADEEIAAAARQIEVLAAACQRAH